ncbi:MAG: hypothetical protein C5B49_16665, partial [Bdellovibrio sp.]
MDLDKGATQRLAQDWNHKFPEIKLEVLPSPYRSVIQPILDYIDDIERSVDSEFVTVIIPEFITSRWYHKFLHNQTAILLWGLHKLTFTFHALRILSQIAARARR